MCKVCDTCGAKITAGYVIDDGLEYYCSDDCLYAVYSEDEYDKLCQENRGYWTKSKFDKERRGDS